MKSFKLQPVAWLTTAGVVFAGLLEADRQFHVLPSSVAHWLAYVAATVALILVGLRAHQASTPVADPKSTVDGVPVPLVPEPAAIPPGATSTVPDPQR